MTFKLFKTALVAATLAATAVYSMSASAQHVPGSNYGTTRSDEASRTSVSNPIANFAGTAVRRMIRGSDAGRVNRNSMQIVPGSKHGYEANEVRQRSSVR